MTKTTEAFIPSLLTRPCPTCGAAAGARCRAKSGNVTYDAHAARYEAERAYYAAPCGIEGHGGHSRAYCPVPA